MAESPEQELPRPFYDDWWGRRRRAAHALWAFHSALTDPILPVDVSEGTTIDSYFDEERGRVEEGAAVRLVSESVWAAVRRACDDFDLSRDLLGAQVEAARTFVGPVQFETASVLDTFVRLWAVPHGRLLAQLAEQSSGRNRWVDELSRGFFYLGRLRSVPADVVEDRLFIPVEELEWAGVSIEALRNGPVTEDMRHLLWKQSVRVRDALAQGEPLIRDLSVWRRYALKRYWMGALAILNELERRDFDLWSEPLGLPWWRTCEVYLQVLFGRTSPG